MSELDAPTRHKQLSDALTSLMRALVHLQKFGPTHPMVPSSLDQAHTLLFPAGGVGWPVSFRRSPSAATSAFELVVHPSLLIDISSQLPLGGRDRMMALFDTLFDGARIEILAILPGCPFQGFRNAFIGLWALATSGRAQRYDDALRMLLGSGALHVLPCGVAPTVPGRVLTPAVARWLGAMRTVFASVSDGTYAGSLDFAAVAETICRGVMQMTDDLRDVGLLLTSVDLLLDGQDPAWGPRVLAELAAAVPAAAVEPIASVCDNVVAQHGGASALGARLDNRGTPLVNYWLAARALRSRTLGAAAPSALSDSFDEAATREPPDGMDMVDPFATEGTDAIDSISRRIMLGSARVGATASSAIAGMSDEVDLRPDAMVIELDDIDAIEMIEMIDEPVVESLELASSSSPPVSRRASWPSVSVSATEAPQPAPPSYAAAVAAPAPSPGAALARSAGFELADDPVPANAPPGPANVPPVQPTPAAPAAPVVSRRPPEASARRTVQSPPPSTVSPPATVPGVEPPPPLDDRVHEWMASFQTLGPHLMERVRHPASDKHYDGAITILTQVGSAFLEAGNYPAAIPILRLFKAQEREAASWPRERALSLAAALGLLLHRARARAVVQALPEADLAHRDAAFELLCAYGPIVVPALAAQLLDTRAPNAVRKEIFAIIEGIGQPAGRALVATVARNARRWNRVLPLIRLLGAIGYREAEPVLADFLKHPEPALRADTLLSLYGALGRESEPYLVEALDDGHTEVRQRAVSLLAVLRSEDPRFLGTLEALLIDALGAVEAGEALVIAAVHAIQSVGNITLPGGDEADAMLANLLRGTTASVVTRVRGKPRPAQSTAVLVAACETLGVLGGDRALASLGHASRSAGPVLRQAATRALERLGVLAA